MLDLKFALVRASLVAASSVALAATSAPFAAEADGEVPTMSTFVCRESLPNEMPTAKMMDSATTLVCRPIAVAIRGDDGKMRTIGNVMAKPVSAPDFSKALTPQETDDAYTRWLEKFLNIDHQVYHSS
jgi:hypothetical protein